jgi:hypothetical protein
MSNFITSLLLLLRGVRIIPHGFFFITCRNKDIIKYEVRKWMDILNMNDKLFVGFF